MARPSREGRPGPPPPSGRARRLRRLAGGHFFEVLLAFVLSLGLILDNPFGHLTALEHHGRDLFNQLFAPGRPGTVSRDRLAVVLLRDADLSEGGLPWPVPYAYHAGVLGELGALRPAAVMVDFLFVDDRRPDTTLGELAREITALGTVGVPVFLAGSPPGVARPIVLARLEAAGARLVPVPRVRGEAGTTPTPWPSAVAPPRRPRACPPRRPRSTGSCASRRRPGAGPATRPWSGAWGQPTGRSGWRSSGA